MSLIVKKQCVMDAMQLHKNKETSSKGFHPILKLTQLSNDILIVLLYLTEASKSSYLCFTKPFHMVHVIKVNTVKSRLEAHVGFFRLLMKGR